MRKNYLLVILSSIFLLTFLFFLGKPKLQKSEEQTKVSVGGKTVWVKIAKTAQEIEQGLSDKEKMCSDCGMLFVFDQKGVYPFWMRRMHFDIDILWLAGDRVADITYGAKKPSKEDFERPKEVFQSKLPVDKVLEVNAGWVEKNGIKVGDKLEIK